MSYMQNIHQGAIEIVTLWEFNYMFLEKESRNYLNSKGNSAILLKEHMPWIEHEIAAMHLLFLLPQFPSCCLQCEPFVAPSVFLVFKPTMFIFHITWTLNARELLYLVLNRR